MNKSKKMKDVVGRLDFYVGVHPATVNHDKDIIYLPFGSTYRQAKNKFLRRNKEWNKEEICVGKLEDRNPLNHLKIK